MSRSVSRVAAILPFLFALAASGQTTMIPRPEAGKDAAVTNFDAAHLKDRPYNGVLPKPAFPSTDRVQREFVVQYVYDYAFSTYTPPVALPIQPREGAKRTTPEAALIAILSAMRAGDYEAWLKCWDENSRNTFIAAAKEKKQDASYWQKIWKEDFGSREVFLVDRIETVSFVILDVRVAGASASIPVIFKFANQEWSATNELGGTNMMGYVYPNMVAVRQGISPQPLSNLTGQLAQEADAQQVFLRSHSYQSTATLAGK